jgi:hypothetical protein
MRLSAFRFPFCFVVAANGNEELQPLIPAQAGIQSGSPRSRGRADKPNSHPLLGLQNSGAKKRAAGTDLFLFRHCERREAIQAGGAATPPATRFCGSAGLLRRFTPRNDASPRRAGRGRAEGTGERKRTMTKRAPAKPTTERYAARFEAEKAMLARHYCTIFKFWRTCALKSCRKARACSGDQIACLRKREKEIPRDAQWQARQEIIESTPANAGPPERTARAFLPWGLAELRAGGSAR